MWGVDRCLKCTTVLLLIILILVVLFNHSTTVLEPAPFTKQNEATKPAEHRRNKEALAYPPVNDSISYGLIFDMGSSGTRVHVYRWRVNFPLRSVVEVGNLKTAPGVSYYAETAHNDNQIADRVATSLLPLLSFAESLTPPNHRSTCRVHAKCTAGCRLLSPEQQKLTMSGVQQAMRDSSFQFKDNWARVIPGEEEALLDWVGINAALGLLHMAQDVDGAIVNVPTVGVMDVGGASAQIAYSVSPVASINDGRAYGRGQEVSLRSEVYDESIYGRSVQQVLPDASRRTVTPYGHAIFHLHLANSVEHTVYAISRLHYGLHDALKVLLQHDVDVMRRNYAGPSSLVDYPAKLPNATDLHFRRLFSRNPVIESAHSRPSSGIDVEILHPCVLKGTYITTAGGVTVGGGGDFVACCFTQQRWLELADVRVHV